MIFEEIGSVEKQVDIDLEAILIMEKREVAWATIDCALRHTEPICSFP